MRHRTPRSGFTSLQTARNRANVPAVPGDSGDACPAGRWRAPLPASGSRGGPPQGPTREGESVIAASLFGSFARGAARRQSDIDIAVLLAGAPRTLHERFGLESRL